MKPFRSALSLAACLLAATITACTTASAPNAPSTNAPPLPTASLAYAQGLGHLHHPVSTTNPDAQRAFDYGLTLCYAFQHDAAKAFFYRAAAFDPHLAMAHWGLAYAAGSNYNDDADPVAEKFAWTQLQIAIALSPFASAHDRAYLSALATRVSPNPQADRHSLAQAYHRAMQNLTRQYPDDLDAATLFAESAMLLHPWQLWRPDGQPVEGTPALVATLESVLKRDPNHIGANHLYIHAVEASPHPERALEAARRPPALAPAAGHLVHMPAHIYTRLGDYAAAAAANEAALRADEAFFRACGDVGDYSTTYYHHNLAFLAYACAMQGRYSAALAAAKKLADHSQQPHHATHLGTDTVITPLIIQVRFERWPQVLAYPPPPSDQLMPHALWNFAQGLAHAARGQIPQAQQNRRAFLRDVQSLPQPTEPACDAMPNQDHALLALAQALLEGHLAWAQHDVPASLAHLQKAVALEDNLPYMEPPDWWLTARESLGRASLLSGNAPAAEKIFRADLARHPASGRSLFGLMKTLQAQGKTDEAANVQAQFQTAWKYADVTLNMQSL